MVSSRPCLPGLCAVHNCFHSTLDVYSIPWDSTPVKSTTHQLSVQVRVGELAELYHNGLEIHGEATICVAYIYCGEKFYKNPVYHVDLL